jgi:beta-ribofuranosylaminobenzene 5'-phosphate synthase
MTVRVEAPARLHLGMLDVVGGGARRFGGLGVAVSRPRTVVEAIPAAKLDAEGPDSERALAVAKRSGFGTGAHVRVLEAIPPHAGLGSGTKLALAVTTALARLAGQDLDPPAIARAAGRGARSAVGLWTFALGGLVVEGGVRPGAERPAPLLARHAMPEQWRCVLAIPDARPGLSGVAEEEAFARLRPPSELSALIAQLVLTSLLPALAEHDLAEFGAALTRLQRLVGEAFAPVQGGVFHPQAAALVDALLAGGAAGAGQTSWGPAVYGIVGDEAAGRDLVAHMERELAGSGVVEMVRFENEGARVTTHPEPSAHTQRPDGDPAAGPTDADGLAPDPAAGAEYSRRPAG